MGTGTKPRRSRAVKQDVEDGSRQPSAYMLGLSEQVASMGDAVLIVQEVELPVHTYVLAANSPVFATALETIAPQQSKRLHKIPLEGDSLPVVCTALRYMYLGSLVVSPSEPAIKSCDDAAALVSFAHKYGITQLVDKAEGYLIGEACQDSGKALFGDEKQLIEWVILAETCKLDGFLAHAERFMIQHMDVNFWQGEVARVKDGISQQCFLRVLRGALHGRQEAVKSIKVLQNQLASGNFNRGYSGYSNCSRCGNSCGGLCKFLVDADQLDVSIATLKEWHKQDE